jgi:hypothetical protein
MRCSDDPTCLKQIFMCSIEIYHISAPLSLY